MKSIKKLLFVMAALAAVFGFVACSNDDDGPSTVAVYEMKYTGYYDDTTQTLTFYDDDTFSWVVKVTDYKGKSQSAPFMKGTYTGDPSKDGKITITATKMYDEEEGKLASLPEAEKDYYTRTITIINGEADFFGEDFTRK